MMKSSIGGNQYQVYLWELGELPVYIYWWCCQFAPPDLLRSVHSENQGFFRQHLDMKVFNVASAAFISQNTKVAIKLASEESWGIGVFGTDQSRLAKRSQSCAVTLAK